MRAVPGRAARRDQYSPSHAVGYLRIGRFARSGVLLIWAVTGVVLYLICSFVSRVVTVRFARPASGTAGAGLLRKKRPPESGRSLDAAT